MSRETDTHDAEVERLVDEVQKVRAEVGRRIMAAVWNDARVLDSAPHDAVFLGAITALIDQALALRAFWFELAETHVIEAPDYTLDYDSFMELVDTCWQDADSVTSQRKKRAKQ